MFFTRRKTTARGNYDAAILVDMQTRFVSALRKGALPRLISSQTTILNQCIESDKPVAVLEYKCSDGVETIPELASLLEKVPRSEVIRKSNNDGFIDTNLHKILRSWEVKHLLLMGINAEYCVLSTTKSALLLGFKVITAPCLIAGPDHHDPKDCISWYKRKCTVVENLS